jgi:hypothetical protein
MSTSAAAAASAATYRPTRVLEISTDDDALPGRREALNVYVGRPTSIRTCHLSEWMALSVSSCLVVAAAGIEWVGGVSSYLPSLPPFTYRDLALAVLRFEESSLEQRVGCRLFRWTLDSDQQQLRHHPRIARAHNHEI